MPDKILVTYASQMGSTASIAEIIGQTLADGGASVDVRRMNDVQDLSPYRAVVAGSAVQGGEWLPEGMAFLRAHRRELSQKPFAAFLVCITMGSANPTYRDGVKNWMEPVRALVRPMKEGYFAGVLDFSKIPLSVKKVMMQVAVNTGALPSGDHRDWAAVRAWAEELKALLGN
jgi:menaquinone-dependent protoporphyrinogen oxidase